MATATAWAEIDGMTPGLSVVSTFTPASISGLLCWLDASNSGSITIATGVSQWNDLSGNAHHVSQSTGSKQPAVASAALNGRNVIRFDGSNDELTWGTPWKAGTTWTVYLVATPTSGTSDYLLYTTDDFSSQISWITGYSSTAFELYNFSGGTTRFTIGSAGATGAHVVGTTRSGTAVASYFDGSASNTGTLQNSNDYNFQSLGNAVGAGNFAACDIAEVIVYNTALGSSDRTSVQSYLKAKWGTP